MNEPTIARGTDMQAIKKKTKNHVISSEKSKLLRTLLTNPRTLTTNFGSSVVRPTA
jgi:hypothetical protein